MQGELEGDDGGNGGGGVTIAVHALAPPPPHADGDRIRRIRAYLPPLSAPFPRVPDPSRIMPCSRNGLRIGSPRRLGAEGRGLLGEFRLNRNNGRDQRRIAYLPQTIDQAAADPCRLRKLAYLVRVHEAPNSRRGFACMRGMISSRPPDEYMSQTAAGMRTALADSAQTLMTDPLAA